MNRAGRVVVIALIVAAIPCLTPVQFPGAAMVLPAQAEEGWQAEFEAVCGKSDESMSMTRDELKALMARCDKLKPLIEAQEETTRKVYLKRLQMCRDLLAYVLEVKSRN